MREVVSVLDHLMCLLQEQRRWSDSMFKESDLRYQQRFDAQNQAIDAALFAAKEAVTKAEQATERRFESVNEFRAALADQSQEFVRKAEFDAIRLAAETRIRELTARLDKSEGKSTGYGSLYGWLIAGAGVIISVVIVVNLLLSR